MYRFFLLKQNANSVIKVNLFDAEAPVNFQSDTIII